MAVSLGDKLEVIEMLGRVGPEELEQLPRVGEIACLAAWQLVVPPARRSRVRRRVTEAHGPPCQS